MPDLTAPKAFISYSWTTPTHEQWVIDLANFLRQSGVDVILDKWDLRDGHDKFAFMEQMVTDPTVKKVIIVSDKVYAEKADGRRGGVGTETQILTPELYGKSQQDKFLAVVTELDDEGQPYLPSYFKNRIYRDMSTREAYDANLEHVLRFIFDRPFNLKPAIGMPPAFLTDETRTLPQSSLLARRATKAIESDSPKAAAQLGEYFDSIPSLAEKFKIRVGPSAPNYDDIQENIAQFLPYRDELIANVLRAIRHYPADAGAMIHGMFERLLPFTSRDPETNQWFSNQFENFKFLINELYLYSVASFIALKRFRECAVFIGTDFYSPNQQGTSESMHSFSLMQQYCETIAHASQAKRRHSLQADLLKERSNLQSVNFEQVKQADFVLYLRAANAAAMRKTSDHWYPASLLYTFNNHQPFEIFARSQSKRYFLENVAPLIGVGTAEEFETLLAEILGKERDYYVPRWEFNRLPVATLANREKIGTNP